MITNLKKTILKSAVLRNRLRYVKPIIDKIRRFTGDTKILFVFNGRSSYWLHMGSSLYKHEPVFKKSIDESREIILEQANTDIIPNFIETADESFWTEPNVFFTLVAVQIAFCDLLIDQNIYPDVSMGFSLGEIAAVYAAGGLTKRDAYNVVSSSLLLTSKSKKKFRILYIEENTDVADKIIEECPTQLFLVSIISQDRSVVLTDSETIGETSEYLNKRNIRWEIDLDKKIWPYHSAYLNSFKGEILTYLDDIDFKPLRCEFYSGVYGKKLSRGALLEKDYWYNYQRYPVQMKSVFEALNNEVTNYQIVQIGPDFFTAKTKNLLTTKRNKTLSTLKKNGTELECFQATLAAAKQIAKNILRQDSSENELQSVIKNYTSKQYHFIQNPHQYLDYLRKHGKIHYLPDLNVYLLLDYNDIKFVLENPSTFSSSLFSSVDSFVLGADPPDHKKSRALLQPLFNRKTYKKVEEYTFVEAKNLIENFPMNRTFNFVDEFSIPLVKNVIAEFLGFTPQEALQIDNQINEHLYGYSYSNKLLDLLTHHLNSGIRSTSGSGVSYLLELAEQDVFSIDDAARLLRILWIAGTTTTSMLITDATLRLLQNPVLAQTLLKNSSLIDPFIEESLRLEGPESNLKRLTTEDVVISGRDIPKGSVLLLSLRSANRDSNYFRDSDQLQFNRPPNKHMSFGSGVHHCLGKVIARFEAKAAISAILPIISSLKLKEDLHSVSYFPSLHFRGIEKLDVILKKDIG